jgi:hypothetical protein
MSAIPGLWTILRTVRTHLRPHGWPWWSGRRLCGYVAHMLQNLSDLITNLHPHVLSRVQPKSARQTMPPANDVRGWWSGQRHHHRRAQTGTRET